MPESSGVICTVLVLIALHLVLLSPCFPFNYDRSENIDHSCVLLLKNFKLYVLPFCLTAPSVAYPSPQYNFCESSATELSSIVRHDIFRCISYLYSTSSPSFFFFYYRLTESAQRFSSFREEYNVTRPGTTDQGFEICLRKNFGHGRNQRISRNFGRNSFLDYF